MILVDNKFNNYKIEKDQLIQGLKKKKSIQRLGLGFAGKQNYYFRTLKGLFWEKYEEGQASG